MTDSIITLLTDFGTQDPYVGILKGVILGINRSVRLIDISHKIPSQDVRGAAYILGISYRYFPQGTIHCAVVDPGVGSQRHGLVVKTHHSFFVGPDNGLFTMVYDLEKDVEVYKITESTYTLSEISHTFHGRDIFAPVAAHLSLGGSCSELGKVIAAPVRIHTLRPDIKGAILEGTIVYVDRFGNLMTNMTRTDVDKFAGERRFEVVADNVILNTVARTYSDASPGTTIALFGSSDHLELSTVMGNAARMLHLGVGDKVSVRRI